MPKINKTINFVKKVTGVLHKALKVYCEIIPGRPESKFHRSNSEDRISVRYEKNCCVTLKKLLRHSLNLKIGSLKCTFLPDDL